MIGIICGFISAMLYIVFTSYELSIFKYFHKNSRYILTILSCIVYIALWTFISINLLFIVCYIISFLVSNFIVLRMSFWKFL
jgi:hypothetical protein